MEPRIEQLMAKVDSKFTLVTLSSMRAREINDYYNQLGEGLGRIVPPQVTSVSRKPLSIAMEEVAAGKIMFERIEPAERRRRGRASVVDRSSSDDADRATPRPEPTRPPMAGRARCPPGSSSACRGGIAAYKAVEVCRRLVDAGVHVAPVLTDDAQRSSARSPSRRSRRSPRAHVAVRRAAIRSRTRGSARPPTSSSSRPRPPS